MLHLIIAAALTGCLGGKPGETLPANMIRCFNPNPIGVEKVFGLNSYTFTFSAAPRTVLTIKENGHATCKGRKVSAKDAHKTMGTYAAIYLAICNPPPKK